VGNNVALKTKKWGIIIALIDKNWGIYFALNWGILLALTGELWLPPTIFQEDFKIEINKKYSIKYEDV